MWKKLKWISISLTLIVLASIGYYAYSVINFANGIHKDAKDSRFSQFTTKSVGNKEYTPTPPKWEGKQRVNVLILGGDSRGTKASEIPRSDSIMVASIDPITKKALIFSILRDTFVKIPGYGEDRINSALALGGPNLAIKTVSDLLGFPIQYYVYTDFKGFIALVDAVGGIDLDVEKNMKYSDAEDGHEYDIDLKKGMQHLNGKSALQYVRFRHDATSDFSRTERQRKFLKVLADKLQTTSSIFKLPRILQSLGPYIETNLTVTEMLKLGSLGFEARTDGIEGVQLPPNELLEEKSVHGAEVLGVNPEKLKKYVQKVVSGENTTTVPSGGNVETNKVVPAR